MGLKVVGSGLGRTGTTSLKLALERLRGGPCYHLREVFQNEGHATLWHRAVREGTTDWEQIFDGFEAAVDWPVSAFWPELADRYPDAIIVHSEREPLSWWQSADATIFPTIRGDAPISPEMAEHWLPMVQDLVAARFDGDIRDGDAAMAAFERHNARVRATAPADRLVLWRQGDGWAPLCDALGLPIPDDPYPHANTRQQFLEHNRPDGDE